GLALLEGDRSLAHVHRRDSTRVVHFSTGSTAACAGAGDGGEWSDPDTGDTHPTQRAGAFGGRGIRPLPRSSRPLPSAARGRSGPGGATPDSAHARAGGAPPLAASSRLEAPPVKSATPGQEDPGLPRAGR